MWNGKGLKSIPSQVDNTGKISTQLYSSSYNYPFSSLFSFLEMMMRRIEMIRRISMMRRKDLRVRGSWLGDG